MDVVMIVLWYGVNKKKQPFSWLLSFWFVHPQGFEPWTH